jgi:hypothetical protein
VLPCTRRFLLATPQWAYGGTPVRRRWGSDIGESRDPAHRTVGCLKCLPAGPRHRLAASRRRAIGLRRIALDTTSLCEPARGASWFGPSPVIRSNRRPGDIFGQGSFVVAPTPYGLGSAVGSRENTRGTIEPERLRLLSAPVCRN